MSTAPSAKFGATSTPTPVPDLDGGAAAICASTAASRLSSQPVVPDDDVHPLRTQWATLAGDASGTENSTTTSAPPRSPRSSPRS